MTTRPTTPHRSLPSRDSARRRIIATTLAVPVTVALLAACGSSESEGETASSDSGDQTMTITFVRHGESAGSGSGLLDTSVRGPRLSAEGEEQTEAAKTHFDGENIDGIYASPMFRSYQTALPLAEDRQEPVQILPGIGEIPGGEYEGSPERGLLDAWLKPQLAWAQGDLSAQIPGSVTGDEFKDGVNQSLEMVAANGDENAVIFTHYGTMQAWTMINTDADEDTFMNDAIRNTGRITVKGSPSEGWELVEWEGLNEDD